MGKRRRGESFLSLALHVEGKWTNDIQANVPSVFTFAKGKSFQRRIKIYLKLYGILLRLFFSWQYRTRSILKWTKKRRFELEIQTYFDFF